MSILYIVATPIGNLGDITLRAIETLKKVDAILCEDTRTTGKLLHHYEIKNTCISYHSNSTLAKEDKIIEMLEQGKNLALVSDAGTPTISDPGVLLVRHLQNHFAEKYSEDENSLEIIAIPGACALTSALSISGVASSEFLFLGFLPHKKGRETLFKEIAASERACAFYESPHRIEKCLDSLEKFVPQRRVTICRELTKMYEQVVHGTPGELIGYFKKNRDKVRGEFVVIIEGKNEIK